MIFVVIPRAIEVKSIPSHLHIASSKGGVGTGWHVFPPPPGLSVQTVQPSFAFAQYESEVHGALHAGTGVAGG